MTQQGPGEYGGGRRKSPEEIEAEIRQQRALISEDIRALGDKLSPRRLKAEARGALHDMKESAVDSLRFAKDNAVDSVSGAASELSQLARRAGTASSSFVTANGVPLALIGLGAGWLSLTIRRQRALAGESERYGYLLRSEYEEARRHPSMGGRARYEELESGVESGYQGEALYGAERVADERGLTGEGVETREGPGERGESIQRAAAGVEALRERVSESSKRVGERVRDRRDDLRGRASDLSREARVRLDHAQQRTRAYAHENPLAIGAVAIAFGFGIGMLLPETPRERRVLGDTSRRLVGEAHKTAERVGRVAKEAASELKSAASPGPSNPPH